MNGKRVCANTSFSLGTFTLARKEREQERLKFLTSFMDVYGGKHEISYQHTDVGVGAIITRRGKYQIGISMRPGIDLLAENSFNCSIDYQGSERHKHIYDTLVDVILNTSSK